MLSEERLAGYALYGATSEAESALLKRYLWNVQLCETLYPMLHFLEVGLRNRLHNALAKRTGSEAWYDHIDLEPRERASIAEAKTIIERRGRTVTPGRVVAELHFGFWCSLFDVRYEHQQRLWPWIAAEVVPHAPRKDRQRKILSSRLNRIRLLRNRIFHYEPIWHWKDLTEQHRIGLETLAWVSVPVMQLVSEIDRFPTTWSAGLLLRASDSVER